MNISALHSNCIITTEGIKNATLVITDGVITDIIEGAPANLPVPITDVKDKVIMAGVIDPHVHINEPGRTEWEGFDTATRAAIAGGITTLVDMPLNASPVTTTVAAFDKKIAAAVPQLHTNCGFWAGLVPGNDKDIEPLIERGALGFKAFLTHSGIDEFPNVTEEDFHKAMPIIAKHGLPLLVHCELESAVSYQRSAVNTSYKAYLDSRPKEWEDNAIALMIRLCEQYHCRTHIVHLSSANSIEQIGKAKQKGLPLTVETAQHYLYFNAEEIPDGQTQFKCAPPIRERANNALLWQALKEGIIDFVATDHSPAPPVIKELESGDLTKAWGGISSIQLALPVLWTAAKKHQASLIQLSQWLCEKPALLAGQQHTRGSIAKGMVADLVVWDAEQTFTVTPENIWHKHKVTPYLDEVLYGVVEQTYIKGVKVFDKGIFTELSKGRILRK